MAQAQDSFVDIFDDFDDAEQLQTTYCQQVSEEKYEDDLRSETDKALGELCLYLDKNPEIYSRVLRKRKQEEMESGGVVSFVKSKVMSLIHGEQYPQCLVSASVCVNQTKALKAGMCKTFQLSQELKGNVTRHSARLAAKQQKQMSINKKEHNQASGPNAKENLDKSHGDLNKSSNSKLSSSSNTRSGPKGVAVCELGRSNLNYASDSPAILVPTVISTPDVKTQNCDNSSGDAGQGNEKASVMCTDLDKTTGDSTPTDSNSKTGSGQCPPPPPPPPPPPFPSAILKSSISRTSSQISGSWKQLSSPRQALRNSTNTPAKGALGTLARDSPSIKRPRTSPRKHSGTVHRENSMSRSVSEQDLSSSRPGSSASMDGPFLTPMVPTKLSSHKRSLSNSSISSTSSSGSFSSIHSELMHSNPVTRLRSTQVVRSPGGTPLRSKTNAMPTEPLHKALLTAMKSKFKNIKTPSPGSVKSPFNGSSNSALESTFSP